MQYAKPMNEVCLFIQEYVFDQSQKTKKTSTYLAACTDIPVTILQYTRCFD